MAPYADSTPELLKLETNSAIVDRALELASYLIDEAFRAGGYVTPIDIAALTAGDDKTRFVARLETICEALAARELTRGDADSGKKVVKDGDLAEAWLGRVAGGLVRFALIAKASSQYFAVTGDPAGGRKNDFTHAVFDNLRRNTGEAP